MTTLEAPYDPRAVANAILIECSNAELTITNLALQKLLYFAHGLFLMRTDGQPLVSGHFEAWTYGPVHPAAYAAFKAIGGEAIKTPAMAKDLRTGKLTEVDPPADRNVNRIIRLTVESYGSLTAGQLVRLSHAKGGPWDVIFQRCQNQRMLGLRISNDLIVERFQYHKASTSQLDGIGDFSGYEDSPLAHYGFG